MQTESERPKIIYPLTKSVEEIEQIIYQHGLAYAVDADHVIAVLTSPQADDDVQH